MWIFPGDLDEEHADDNDDDTCVINVLCLVHVDNFMLACSDSPFVSFDSINNLYGELGSHECSHNAEHE